ncbi:hypothetical protein OE88DRAFT_1630361 [Heliocybe sulcata]|uniref:Uncharacterized protein n=1 Tax=Heliocybe sulcata TaxID=5364 RepID=A0A5C3N0A4_9AGAM|nr:hypothetical protein OE88DRAFT_1630361 [Heliocybe sulcata]
MEEGSSGLLAAVNAPDSEIVDTPESEIIDRPVSPAGRGRRKKRPTWKILEQLLQPCAPVEIDQLDPPPPDALPSPQASVLWKTVRTVANVFGLSREYRTVPSSNPEETVSLEDLSNIPGDRTSSPPSTSPPAESEVSAGAPPQFAPFSNMSVWRLMSWMWGGSHTKSVAELDRLVHDVILAPDFSKEDFQQFDAKRETAKLDESLQPSAGSSTYRDGWHETAVEIAVPDGKAHRTPDSPVPMFAVPGLHFRSIIEVIKAAWQDARSRRFHFVPFKEYWQHTSSRDLPQRVYHELYASDAFTKAHEELQEQLPEPDCNLERVICALMFWSDSTHLASFGNASLWPIYMFFGNQSKYDRAKPSSSACHHIAYIPKLPDSFFDYFLGLTGQGPSADMITHCRREIMHAVWRILLDDDFMHAYEHGMVITCSDGVMRRVFPRIFTYSADYPEKVLLANIRNLGDCPCPRCKIQKARIPEMGTKRDMARRTRDARVDSGPLRYDIARARELIYEDGRGVKSAAVEGLLRRESLVPTSNAFSEKLAPFGFNVFSMFVVDLLHEFELGVWKVVFTHLIRILHSCGGESIQSLNQRFRCVPTFGRSTIRRFSNNASAMKKLAARDFEDLLQCSIPVFEGLLPEPHNKNVGNLLFALAEWHASAKLRLHTESTLQQLESSTSYLGTQLHHFVNNTCPCFDTKELPREEAARARRKQRAAHSSVAATPAAPGGHKRKTLNLSTCKCHALGDYANQIRAFGTSDGISTQPGEFEHRRVKRFYARTNKNQATMQIARLQRREQALTAHMLPTPRSRKGRLASSQLVPDGREALPYMLPEHHHHISHSRNFPLYLPQFIRETEGDPVVYDFLPKLKNHLLERLKHPDLSVTGESFSLDKVSTLLIQSNRVFRHQTMRVNYTTYDVRREQDSMNPSNHADIMLLAPGAEEGVTGGLHPFEYARILGIFHADVILNVPGTLPKVTTVEFLFVRWFDLDHRGMGGFAKQRLHRLKWRPDVEGRAFSFVDPDEVIRGAHLIPAFALGEPENVMTGSEYYYVNMFVDRDMYMRYKGGGVGHVKINSEVIVEFDDTVEGLDGSGEGEMEEGGLEEPDCGESESGTSDSDSDASAEPGREEEGCGSDEEGMEGLAPL